MIDLDTIPFSVAEIKFEDERMFRMHEQLWVAERSEEVTRSQIELSNAICAITKWDPEELLREVIFSIEDDPVLVYDEKSPESVDYVIRDGDEISILRLYLHIDTIIRSYQTVDAEYYSIWYGKEGEVEEEYIIRDDILKSVIDGDNDLTTGEAVEVMQFQSQLKKLQEMRDEKLDEEEDGQVVDGAFLVAQEWKARLQEAAILLRREGDKLPLHKLEREKWIKDRSAHLRDIGLKEMLDVRFFLTNSCVYHMTIAHLAHSGEEGLSSGKSHRKPKLIFRGSKT